MSTGNGGQSNDSNNLSTAISGQCAESSEIINRSIELGGQSIVYEMSTENSGQLIDSNGKSTEKSGRLISVNDSGPTLNCNNNNDNGNFCIKRRLGKKKKKESEFQMGFEPTTLRDLAGRSNH